MQLLHGTIQVLIGRHHGLDLSRRIDISKVFVGDGCAVSIFDIAYDAFQAAVTRKALEIEKPRDAFGIGRYIFSHDLNLGNMVYFDTCPQLSVTCTDIIEDHTILIYRMAAEETTHLCHSVTDFTWLRANFTLYWPVMDAHLTHI